MGSIKWLAVVTLIGIVGVEFGGNFLLKGIEGTEELSEEKARSVRSGHAHAGTELVLALVYFWYLADTSFSTGVKWLAGVILLVGVMAQSGGFFLHVAAPEPNSSSTGTRVSRGGGIALAVALVLLAIGLATK